MLRDVLTLVAISFSEIGIFAGREEYPVVSAPQESPYLCSLAYPTGAVQNHDLAGTHSHYHVPDAWESIRRSSHTRLWQFSQIYSVD